MHTERVVCVIKSYPLRFGLSAAADWGLFVAATGDAGLAAATLDGADAGLTTVVETAAAASAATAAEWLKVWEIFSACWSLAFSCAASVW